MSQNQSINQDPAYLDALLNENEAAAFLGFTNRALQLWRLKGRGPEYVRVSSRAVRYRRRELIEWSEARLVKNTAQPLEGVPA